MNINIKKGLLLQTLHKHNEAIEAFTKAENEFPKRNFPLASYLKGNSLFLLKRYSEALASYSKSEQDNHGVVSQVLIDAKGMCHLALKEWENALLEFTKLEGMVSNSKFNGVFYKKGSCLYELSRWEDAIKDFYKAKTFDPGHEYGKVLLNMGICLVRICKWKDAIQELNEAERHLKSNKSYIASYFRGFCLTQLFKLDDAIEAFTKAINNAPKSIYPDASFAKGVCLLKLNKVVEALDCFKDAEIDSANNTFPDASYNRGVCLKRLFRIQKAIVAFIKSNNDSLDGCHVLSTIQLAKIHLSVNYQLSKKYALKAIKYDSRSILAIQNWKENYILSKDDDVYSCRIKYLNYVQEISINIEFDEKYNFNYLNNQLTKSCVDNSLIFCNLLLSKNFTFSFSLDEQYRLAYLVHFNHCRPWLTYYIIDELMDGDESINLTSFDYYFYCLSAYMIGEPSSELKWFWNNEALKGHLSFTPLKELISNLKVSYKSYNYKDDYLLDIKVRPISNNADLFLQRCNSKEAAKVIHCISANELYKQEIIDNSVLSQLSYSIINYFHEHNKRYHLNSFEYKNFLSAIEKLDDIDHIVYTIRQGVKSGDRELFIFKSLSLLQYKFLNEASEPLKKLYATSQIVTITSYAKDFKEPLFYNSWKYKLGAAVTEEIGGSSLNELLHDAIGVTIGIIYSIPFKLITRLTLRRKLNQIEIHANKMIKELKIIMKDSLNEYTKYNSNNNL